MNEPRVAPFSIVRHAPSPTDEATLSTSAQAALARLSRRLIGARAPEAEDDVGRSPWRRRKPLPGWNVGAFTNPRPPATPATLHLSLDEYYAAAATIGLLSAQEHEPDPEWAMKWSLDYGTRMAREARRRRAKRDR